MMNENFLLILGSREAPKPTITLGEPDYPFEPLKMLTAVTPYEGGDSPVITWGGGLGISANGSRIFQSIPDNTGQLSFYDISNDKLSELGMTPWGGSTYVLTLLNEAGDRVLATGGRNTMYCGDIFNPNTARVTESTNTLDYCGFYHSVTDDSKVAVISQGSPIFRNYVENQNFVMPARPIWIYEINENFNLVNRFDLMHPETGQPFHGVATISGDGSTLFISTADAVFIMRKVAGNWTVLQKITTGSSWIQHAGDVKANMNGSMFAYAIPQLGRVFVMRETHEGWVLKQELTGTAGSTSQFGRRMAASRNMGTLSVCDLSSNTTRVHRLDYDSEQFTEVLAKQEYMDKAYGVATAVSRDGRFVVMSGKNVPILVYYS